MLPCIKDKVFWEFHNDGRYEEKWGNVEFYYKNPTDMQQRLTPFEQHVDNLFRECVDYCLNHQFIDYQNRPMINSMIKDMFHNFCVHYTHSVYEPKRKIFKPRIMGYYFEKPSHQMYEFEAMIEEIFENVIVRYIRYNHAILDKLCEHSHDIFIDFMRRNHYHYLTLEYNQNYDISDYKENAHENNDEYYAEDF